MQRRGLVLAYLMRLKQTLQPSQPVAGRRPITCPTDSGKFARLAEICEEIASRQEKVLVFTQFREMTEPLAGFLAPAVRPRRAGAPRRDGRSSGADAGATSSSATTDRRSSCCRSRRAARA